MPEGIIMFFKLVQQNFLASAAVAIILIILVFLVSAIIRNKRIKKQLAIKETELIFRKINAYTSGRDGC